MSHVSTKVLTAQIPLPLDREEERSRLTRQALADVDAGRVIDQEAVQTWADSLESAIPSPTPR